VRADTERTKHLQSLGWTILRFWNDDVLKDIDGVCQHIVLVAAQMKAGMERA
jgi:very-short-patch-repair endonuclease